MAQRLHLHNFSGRPASFLGSRHATDPRYKAGGAGFRPATGGQSSVGHGGRGEVSAPAGEPVYNSEFEDTVVIQVITSSIQLLNTNLTNSQNRCQMAL